MFNRFLIIVFVSQFFLLLGVSTGFAQAVDEPLPDAAQEQQAREIMLGIRCLVCQNQSIEDSDADLAVDLRQIVREQVSSGKDQEEIHQFLIERYGDWILLSPPFKARTLLLWVGPFIFLSLAFYGVVLTSRKGKTQQADEVDGAEKTSFKGGEGLTKTQIAILAVGLIGTSLFLYISLGKPDMVVNSNSQLKQGEDDELIEIYNELKAFVEDNPENIEALGRFADLNLTMGRYGTAANAYGNLHKAQPKAGVLPLVLQGEALVRQAQGTVTPAARLTFLNVVKREPTHPAARYYLGLWFSQNQEPERALQIWQSLKAESREDAPWLNMLEFQINNLQGDGTQAQSLIPAPNQDAIEAVANMSDEEQAAFIDNMVDRLRSRLQSSPNDFAGWWRLAKVEEQRGNIEEALVALEQAEKYAPAIEQGEISAEYLRLERILKD